MPNLITKIPFFSASSLYLTQKKEIDNVIQKVLTEGAFINGKEVELFSANLATYLGIDYVIPCANGTDALTLALLALDLKKGDEVIIPTFNFIAAAEAVALLGLTPVFIDACGSDFNIDVSLIENSITSDTKAIIVVHLFGAAAQMDDIKRIAGKNNLFVVEDVAQSLGSEYKKQKLGTIGHIGCTSFFPTKNLSCFGDGGAVFCKDPILANRLKMIANHGQSKKYEHELIGINSRLDTIQAAVLNVQLSQLDKYIEARRNIAKKYYGQLQHLANVCFPVEMPDTLHSYNQYCILLENELVRNELKEFLLNAGISTMVYYSKSIHLQKAFSQYKYIDGAFPTSENLCLRVLALPIFPSLKEKEQFYIIEHVKKFFTNVN